MSRRTSKRVSFGPDVGEKPTMFLKHGGSGTTTTTRGNKRRVVFGIFMFRVVRSSSFSPASILRHVGAKVAGALRFVSIRGNNSSSRKVSASKLSRSRSLAESVESHRAEAIKDCIEFLNSSSSLSRSNSVSTCSC
ncbi:Sulfoquinovosyldiacylglycerol 2 [Hibiscus syriacus]|uniref:Sulfoquinovosyldiacylglycerol 2 n=1 Tax=Hibiscus syriacus TaxID=106335 RepID=A0A6A3BM34_HIBSY|nr:josephin-like protein [Hibiscus syriacus]KAE8717395.1 Sulfoquinovosyldiacylglycerol 2 [Hibiscus syriacus]